MIELDARTLTTMAIQTRQRTGQLLTEQILQFMTNHNGWIQTEMDMVTTCLAMTRTLAHMNGAIQPVPMYQKLLMMVH